MSEFMYISTTYESWKMWSDFLKTYPVEVDVDRTLADRRWETITNAIMMFDKTLQPTEHRILQMWKRRQRSIGLFEDLNAGTVMSKLDLVLNVLRRKYNDR